MKQERNNSLSKRDVQHEHESIFQMAIASLTAQCHVIKLKLIQFFTKNMISCGSLNIETERRRSCGKLL